MSKSFTLNAALLIAITFFGYAMTSLLYQKKPNIITQPKAPAETLNNGAPAPDFTFTTPGGKAHKLSDFKGKLIVLNFWASWCPPCIKEFPHFVKLATDYKDDVIFIALSSDIDEAAMQKFLQKIKGEPAINLDQNNIYIALDSKNVTKEIFQTYTLPETILIDKNQIMRQKIIGADWTYEDLTSMVKPLLSK